MERREFLKTAGTQATALAAFPVAPAVRSAAAEVVVIGAGAFGGWSAFHLRRMGASVHLIDMYGPGNSRATSGDETRGIRSSYGTRESWVVWAKQSIKLWQQWDDEWAKPLKRRIYFPTGDLIMRANEDAIIRDSKASWDKYGFKYEVLSYDEARYRFPQIRMEGMTAFLYEPDAGVARSRAATQVVADAFLKKGGRLTIARATPAAPVQRRMNELTLDNGDKVRADTFVFACGPWLGKVFPQLMAPRLRTPLGHVFYFGTPPGDQRFIWPNCPSWNVPGVTGWPALGSDNRGFRVRTGGRQPSDPDTSVRWIDSQYHEVGRNVLRNYFPDLVEQPLLETRACHYESSASRNFVIDKHPDYDNVWIVGGGNAEAFKMGPVAGEYTARRVLGKSTDPKLDEQFRITADTYETQPPRDPREAQRLGMTEVEELL